MNFSEPLKLTTPFDSLWTFFLSSGEITRSGSMGWNSKSVLTDKWTPPRVTGIPVYTREDKKKKKQTEVNWSPRGTENQALHFYLLNRVHFFFCCPATGCPRWDWDTRRTVAESVYHIQTPLYEFIHTKVSICISIIGLRHMTDISTELYIYIHIFFFFTVLKRPTATLPPQER